MMSRRICSSVAVWAFSLLFVGTASADALMDAYKKEFAFLEAEKTALKKRIVSVDEEAKRKIAAAKSEITSLETQILGIRAKADEIELALEDVEEQTASAEERSDLLAETIDRAAETLKRHEVKVNYSPSKDIATQAETIETLFAKAGNLLRKANSIRVEKGMFFDQQGTLQPGEIVRIGQVAAYGVGGNVAGALAPAGSGRFKIWNEDATASAKAVLKGDTLPALAMFLFESLEKGIDEKKEKTPLEVVQSGGIIAWVIVGIGGVGLLMILLRVLILLRAGSRTDRLLGKLKDAMNNGTTAETIEICKKSKGAAARVLKSTIRNLDRGRDHLEDIVSEAILHEAPFIERFGSTIMVIAAIAPLLGLLGTVTGMISTFDIITEHGTGDPKLLSGGISEALVTTELGLIVAIPTLLIGTLLSGRANGILQSLERAALQIMNLAEQPEIKARMQLGANAGPPKAQPPVSPTSKRNSGKKEAPLNVAEEPAT